MSNPAPGFRKNPDHGIATGLPTAWVTIRAAGTDIAQTKRGVRLDEDGYPERYYIPMEDVAEGALHRIDRTTECPFKGTATYFDVRAGDRTFPAAAWSYERPYDEMTKIGGHVAFAGEGLEVLAFET